MDSVFRFLSDGMNRKRKVAAVGGLRFAVGEEKIWLFLTFVHVEVEKESSSY